MKTCVNCINFTECERNGTRMKLSNSLKCTRYAWIGDGKMYKAHDGLRPTGKKPMTLMELIAHQKSRDKREDKVKVT